MTRPISMVLCAALAGCAAMPPGPKYQEPTGPSTALLVPRGPVWDLSRPMNTQAEIRIHEINGQAVSMPVRYDLRVPAGTTRVGIHAWTGIPVQQIQLCVVFDAKPGKDYVLRVAGPLRDWGVSLTTEGVSPIEEVTPSHVSRTSFDMDTLPCSRGQYRSWFYKTETLARN